MNPIRRNVKILLDAVAYLVDRGITDFNVTVIGSGNLEIIDPKIRRFFSVLGRVPYPVMYAETAKSDFFLTLFDPDNPDHGRYITLGTSGSFQMIYGFAKPCLIAEKFASVYGFSLDNSIVYKENKELGLAMEKAITMTDVEYEKMRRNLVTMADEIYKQSLDNLGRVLGKAGTGRDDAGAGCRVDLKCCVEAKCCKTRDCSNTI